jgi:glycolate oxidase FAD binding subunit
MIDDEAIIKRLEQAVGPKRVLAGESARAYGTTGFAPFVAVVPEDRQQAAEAIRIAADSHVGLLARGGGTKLGWEPVPTGMVVAVSTERLNKVVQHEPRDLTVTVEAGLVLGELNAMLGEHRQRLSIDPPQMDYATLGGIAAANDSGPLRCGYGAMRDLVVGMEVTGVDGVATRSGGQIVKNVAGYDMHRLHIGAFGSLGLITEMSFRLHPLPEMFRLAVVHCGDGERAEECIASILAGRTRPVLVELITLGGETGSIEQLDGRAASSDAWTLVVGYEDCREAVAWQCEHLAESVSVPVDVRDEAGSQALYASLREWPARAAPVAFKATMKSSQVVAFHAWARERGFRLVSHAASGVVYGRSDDPDAVEAGEDMAAVAADGGGHLTWTTLPDGADVSIWKPPRGDLSIMKRIKETFDPQGVFAPGRFVDEM